LIDGGAGHNTYVVGQPSDAGVKIDIDVPTNEWQYIPSPVGGGSFVPLIGSFVYYSGGSDFLTQVEASSAPEWRLYRRQQCQL
jgi:hypothetical protein